MKRALLLCALVVAGGAGASERVYVAFGTIGRTRCTSAAPGWQLPASSDGDWRDPTTLTATPVDGGAAAIGCAGTQYERWHFDVGDALTKLRTLTLRIRYTHGFAAYLNGVEVARQRLAPDADAFAVANDWHDLETERISIPVRPETLRATDNVLAIEVHPRNPGKQPTVDVELDGSESARLVRGPYLQQLGEHGVTIVFDTDLPTLGKLEWGRDDHYGSSARDPAPAFHHALRITGLTAGTVYHYRVRAAELIATIDAGDAWFHTPPAHGIPRFIVYGDTRSGHDVHAQLDLQMATEDPDFAIVTGDLVARGTDDGDWNRFFEIAATFLRQVAIFPAPGNHDFGLAGRGLAVLGGFFRARFQPFDPSYYSFDISGLHFAALDSNRYNTAAQREWLERDLTAAESRHPRAIFVYAHEPPYSTGPHGNNALAIQYYVPIMVRHHVAMFFGGHDHHYERGRVDGFDYVISGGGGAELRPPRCGIEDEPACPPSVFFVAKQYHYVVVEVLPRSFRVCPKHLDGTPLEACTTLPLHR